MILSVIVTLGIRTRFTCFWTAHYHIMISITEPTDSKGFSELLFNVFPIEKIHGFPQKWTDIIKDEKECIIKIMGKLTVFFKLPCHYNYITLYSVITFQLYREDSRFQSIDK